MRLVYITTSANTWQTLPIPWEFWQCLYAVGFKKQSVTASENCVFWDQLVQVFAKLRRETEGIRKERSWPQKVSRISTKAAQISPLQPFKTIVGIFTPEETLKSTTALDHRSREEFLQNLYKHNVFSSERTGLYHLLHKQNNLIYWFIFFFFCFRSQYFFSSYTLIQVF